MELERGEAIQAWAHPGLRRVRRWQSGHPAASDCVHVLLGQLPDGRWFAERAERARAYGSREAAEVVCRRLMADRDDWEEVPAQLGPDNRPIEPGWTRSGQRWMRIQKAQPSSGRQISPSSGSDAGGAGLGAGAGGSTAPDGRAAPGAAGAGRGPLDESPTEDPPADEGR